MLGLGLSTLRGAAGASGDEVLEVLPVSPGVTEGDSSVFFIVLLFRDVCPGVFCIFISEQRASPSQKMKLEIWVD